MKSKFECFQVERPSPPPSATPKPQQTKAQALPSQKITTKSKDDNPPTLILRPAVMAPPPPPPPAVHSNSSAPSRSGLTAAIQMTAAGAAVPSVSPQAIRHAEQKCTTWLSQKTKHNAPRLRIPLLVVIIHCSMLMTFMAHHAGIMRRWMLWT